MDHKAPDAFRTISEVAEDLDLPQHVLRFWETRFVQIKPLKRGGGRRYYRPDDIDLLKGIRQLLYGEGYTIKGVQRILKEQGPRGVLEIGRGLAVAPPMPDAVRAGAPAHVHDDLFEPAADDSLGGEGDGLAAEPADADQFYGPDPVPAGPEPAATPVHAVRAGDEAAILARQVQHPHVEPRRAGPASAGIRPAFAVRAPEAAAAPPEAAKPPLRAVAAERPLPEAFAAGDGLPPGILADDKPHRPARFVERMLGHDAGKPGLSRDDVRRLQATLFELLECKRVLDQAR